MVTLNIFIDESGSFDFTPKGSKHFILTAVAASDCATIFPDFFSLKHDIGCEEFHATEDKQDIRDRMYSLLERHCAHGCFSIDSIIAQKNRVNPTIREDAVFYAKLLRILLRWVFRYRATGQIERINVWAARIGTHRKKAVFEKAVKTYLAHDLDARIPYKLLIHGSASHPMLQVADYCCWAVAKKWKDGELRPYHKIQRALKTEFEVFRGGVTEYY
jgi:Protein of unknown function (DUF3800)